MGKTHLLLKVLYRLTLGRQFYSLYSSPPLKWTSDSVFKETSSGEREHQNGSSLKDTL